MAEDIAREIIAQSKEGSKLAFSFSDSDGDDVFLFTSRDSKERIVYHVHKCRNDTKKYEFKYVDLASAVALLQTFVRSGPFFDVQVGIYDNAVDFTEVASFRG